MVYTYLPNGDKINARTQTAFGGLNHTPAASDGEFYALRNLTSDLFPLLSSRRARTPRDSLGKANGLYAKEALVWVDGTDLYYDGEVVGQVEDGPKTFASLGNFLLIFPDKKYLLVNWTENNIYDRFGDLEASYSKSGLVFGDGEYAGAEAEANSLTTTGQAFPFRVGDAVTISACTEQTGNNKTPIIQEISEDGKTLRFYPNTFYLPEGETSYTEPGTVTLARTVPDMEWFCENENRLWGSKGKELFACKLGDPFNWNVFAGLSTDSYNTPTGTDGDFTAAVSYLGFPVFFKPGAIHKVYGSKPSNFQAICSANMGVAPGSGKSPAIVGNTLYYLSESGVVSYQGGIPTLIDGPLGGQFRNGVGGTDGKKYYISMEDEAEQRRLFVYDPTRNIWHEEDDPGIEAMANLGPELYFLAGNQIWQVRGESYDGVEWQAETGDYYNNHYGKKRQGPYITLRHYLAPGAEMTVEVSYDGEDWKKLSQTISGTGVKGSTQLPNIPARCDYFRLRFTGRGEMRLYSLALDMENGSPM